ncbi:hypothetical protein GIB67_023370 [Kingdonia uniflora]|uniref:Transcriptional coactivator Hfi1/Transcriptional adapter 1 n=1 Tax=Kingdonia uniflora TaxID=39325 RepID=A0A7J7LI83_9MAGN|nr:hypothetical protein GIB67_023370 [Kingdonia uniflora]
MQPSQQQHSQSQSRVSLSDLKAQIEKKIGPERSKWYFGYLNRFFSQKLSKDDFDKLCFRTIGRENLPLHNHLIRAILKNTLNAKVPPAIPEKEAPSPPPPKLLPTVGKKPSPTEDSYQQCEPSSHPNSIIWSNGDVLPPSPRKIRSGVRGRKGIRDRPSPLGPNGKIDFTSNISTTQGEGNVKVITENGHLSLCDLQRPVHQDHHQGLAEQCDNETNTLFQRPSKRPRSKKSTDDSVSLHSIEGHVESLAIEDEGKVGPGPKRGEISLSTRSPLRAPLGIPFCPASVGGARRVLPMSNTGNVSFASDVGELFDTETLRKRMEQIVEAQGLEGVSSDCANLLNNGLDLYLKRLIRSCIDLVGSRTGHQPTNHPLQKQHAQGKPLNGLWPCHQSLIRSNSGPTDGIQEQRSHCPISLSDFKVAMELNPQQLGEHWSLLLEKICTHACEE